MLSLGLTVSAIALDQPQARATLPEALPTALLEEIDPMAQVTSVSQLTDVKPTDWAFQALQSLVERYGCIAGYPDRTYRGNRAMTRYEFAAGVNACMDRVNELIAAATADQVKKEDLATLQKLQEEFAAELATLRGRVNALEAKTATLEKQQFSTTTKLRGEVITFLADAFGADASAANNTIAIYRARLEFNTSFTGKDVLRTRLEAANLQNLNAGNPNIDNVSGGFGSPQRFGSTFPGAFSDETRLLAAPPSVFDNTNDLRLHDLSYNFSIGDRINVAIAAGTTDPPSLGLDPVTPLWDFATGSISNFANSNPIYYPLTNRAALGVNFKISEAFTLVAGYGGQDIPGVGAPNLPGASSGLFNGGYAAFTQLTFYAKQLTAGLFYSNTYTPQFGIDTLAGSNAAKISTGGFSTPEDDRVSSNNFGFAVNYRLNPGLQVGGWVGYSRANVLGMDTSGLATGNRGNVGVLNYAIHLAMPDLGKKGNIGGIIVGMQPKVVSTSNDRVAAAIGLPGGIRRDRDTGFHIEAFYTMRLNDAISITPGIIWLTAPNHDARNPDAIVGTIRTAFVF
jgi:Carbohydrate-selective porin, OprB family/S-layer homology domain